MKTTEYKVGEMTLVVGNEYWWNKILQVVRRVNNGELTLETALREIKVIVTE